MCAYASGAVRRSTQSASRVATSIAWSHPASSYWSIMPARYLWIM